MAPAEPLSRLEQLKAQGIIPQYPENPAPWLTARLMEIGPTEDTGQGPAQLSWRELRHWQDQMGVELLPWELRMLRRLSLDWKNESLRAVKKKARAPTAEMTQEMRRKLISDQVDAMFGAMAAAPPPATAAIGKKARKRKSR